ncbi:MAG: phosphopantothenoylcysteine decarboxylase, partial [Thermoanaerobaculia bacterium]
LAPPARITKAILEAGARAHSLEGRRVLVTAGPTREPVDPVRFLSNRSSGKMGHALAREAARRGAEVVLVTGPVSLAPPPGVRVVRVERAADMRDAVVAEVPSVDALLMAAAPADFTVAEPARTKIKRAAGVPGLALVATPDILREAAAAARKTAVLVGFAAETHELLANAEKKLAARGVDLLVANDVARPGIGFDADENEVLLLAPDRKPERVDRASKTVVAGRILDRVAALLDVKCPKTKDAHAPATR